MPLHQLALVHGVALALPLQRPLARLIRRIKLKLGLYRVLIRYFCDINLGVSRFLYRFRKRVILFHGCHRHHFGPHFFLDWLLVLLWVCLG